MALSGFKEETVRFMAGYLLRRWMFKSSQIAKIQKILFKG